MRRPRFHPAALSVLAGLLALAQPARAAEPSARMIRFDAANTKVTFTLGATFHTVEGTARVSRGRLVFDPAGRAVSGEVVVDATSANTQEAGRDRDMHQKVLESKTYPEIVFTPRKVEGDFHPNGESDLTLGGTLDIHGGRHDLTVRVHLQMQGDQLHAHAEFTVPYVAWGMKDPSLMFLRVKKDVAVVVEFSGPVLPAADVAGN